MGPAIEMGLLRVAVAEMQFWHCPVARNTAHKFAWQDATLRGGPGDVVPHDIFLCNVDCDNVFSSDFVPAVLEKMGQRAPRTLYQFCGDDRGVSGRMAYWCRAFCDLRGFDETLTGSCYLDVDLMH